MSDLWSRIFADVFTVSLTTFRRLVPDMDERIQTQLAASIGVEVATRVTDPTLPPLETDRATQTEVPQTEVRPVATVVGVPRAQEQTPGREPTSLARAIDTAEARATGNQEPMIPPQRGPGPLARTIEAMRTLERDGSLLRRNNNN